MLERFNGGSIMELDFQAIKLKFQKLCKEILDIYDEEYSVVKLRTHGIENSDDYLKLWGRLEDAYCICHKVFWYDYGDSIDALICIFEDISNNIKRAMPDKIKLAEMIPNANCFLNYRQTHERFIEKISEINLLLAPFKHKESEKMLEELYDI